MDCLLEPYKGRNIQGEDNGGAEQVFPRVRARGKNNIFALADGRTLFDLYLTFRVKTLKECLVVISNRLQGCKTKTFGWVSITARELVSKHHLLSKGTSVFSETHHQSRSGRSTGSSFLNYHPPHFSIITQIHV